MKRSVKKKLSGMVVSTLAASMLFPVGGTASAQSTPTNVLSNEAYVNFKIMATTDIHGSIMNHDYYSDVTADKGLAKVATLINEERTENANNLLLDNGDLLQGNPFTDYVAKVNPLTFVDRVAGDTRYSTAVEVSNQGWNMADTVIIARADDYADALTATPLAYQLDAPILLTGTDKLNADTKAEIKRLKAKKVIILGGTSAVSDAVQKELQKDLKVYVKRIAGDTRYETAVEVATELGSDFTSAVLAYGRNFPDAVSIAAYAAKNGLPIFLTEKDTLPESTKAALAGVESTIIVGGVSVISEAVAAEVTGAERIAGETRYETSYKIASELDAKGTKTFLTTGSNFADALTGSVLAAKEGANVLLVSGEDLNDDQAAYVDGTTVTLLGGTAAVSDELVESDTHPIYEAMNLLDYDAATFGNHEFNYGLDFLKGSIAGADFPYVSANVYIDDQDGDDSNNETYAKPYQIIEKTVVDKDGNEQTVKVGVIGFVAPQITQWDKANLEGKIVTEDIVASAEKWIPMMKEDGADVVVALNHSGFDKDKTNKENTVYDLSEVEGIDAIIFGHTHLSFPGTDASFKNLEGVDPVKGTINGVAAVQANVDASALGIIDLELQKKDGKWSVVNSQSEVKTAAGVAVDQEVVDVMSDVHAATREYINSPVGETTAPIHSYFARMQDDPSVQIVNNAQTEYVREALKGTEYENLPLLSAAAPFKAGRNGADEYTYMPAGDITIKNVSDLYKYNNTVQALKITGAQLKEWLEWSAVNFNQIDPTKTEEQTLINPNFRAYNFDTIDGVTYEFDLTQPARYDVNGTKVVNADAHRVKSVKYNGVEVSDTQEFVVATNNYRATFTPVANPDGKRVIFQSPDENRQVVMNYIIKNQTINPSADINWKIAPIDGSNLNVTFETSGSTTTQNLAKEISRVSYVGASDVTKPNGFHKYKIDLSTNVKVQLLGINDFHGQVNTYATISGKQAGGIQYLAAYLKNREATNPANTVMLHAGDAVGASAPVSALLQDEPTIDFFNRIGFDIGTVGNHEFDEGVAEMLRLINGGTHPKTGDFEGANFPYIAANVINEATNEPLLDPYLVKEFEGIKVGFIGVALSDTPSIVIPSGTAGVKFTDETEAINKYTAELKAQGVEAIVVIAHNPVKSNTDGTNPTEELVTIANAVDDEVDVLYGAHNHAFANTTVDGKILVQSYASGTAFSDVDLELDPVTKDVVKKNAAVVTTFHEGVTPDAEIAAILKAYEDEAAPVLGRKIGVAADLIDKTQNASGESEMGNVIADSMRWFTGTDFAFMNVGGVRASIDAGDITWEEAFKVQPFSNDVVTMDVTGEQIYTLFENQWGTKERILQVSGIKASFNSSLAAGSRMLTIEKINADGTTTPIDKTATYSITVNNYMAGGGDGYTVLKEGKNQEIKGVDLDVLVKYIEDKGTISTGIEGRMTRVN